MLPNNYNLEGKTALITGSAGLLGKHHAKALAELKCNIILTDINTLLLGEHIDDLTTAHNCEVMGFQMDVTKKSSIVELFQFLESKNTFVDILINNAAINPSIRPPNQTPEATRFENFELDEWCRQIDVGLTGAFLCSQIFGNAMAESNKSGVILNIASDLSVIAPDQRLYSLPELKGKEQPTKPVSYSVVKTGLIGLTRYLAAYWAEKGVRCNALSPGGIKNNQNELFIQKLESLIPLGRMANVDDYESAVQFLCSDASAYMTGQNIVIDGGRSIL